MNNVVKNSKASPKKSVTAKQLAKSNLTKRKNPDWDNLDRGYRYLTLDMKLPHDLAVAVMGNVVEESLGDYKSTLKNGRGRGLIQWDGRNVPNGRYSLWGSIWASVAKPANVYDSTTDTVKNYWAPWGGLKGDKVRQKFIKAPLKEKTRIYAESYLRPGKPRIADRQLSTMQLDSIYNPKIKDIIVLKDGGILEFLKNGGQVRKMQTAAGGPIRRLKFTPEQIAYFESRGLPLGVNNSKNYRKEGILALLHQELEKARKELEIASRMEIKPVLVKKASKLGEKDLYKLQVNTAAGVVSPVDPVAEFFMYGNPTLKGVGALAKTGLLGAARYAPKTQLGNYGRLYFVGNAFKNSFNGAVPTLTSQATSLLYQPVKLNEFGLTSLKFFERKPARISEAERKGFSKGKEYYTKELNESFLKQINDFAEKYGYIGLKEGNYTSEQLNAYARALIDRHNKFYRGVVVPIGEDLKLAKQTLGNSATDELMLKHVATHSRGEDINPELYISPTTNAFSYGANGKTAIISRPYKLGRDRTKWFDEGDFNIVETGTVNPKSYNNFLGIVYPWSSPRFLTYNPFLGKKTIPEYYNYLTPLDIIEGGGYYEYIPNPYVQNELISINNPMVFRLWVEKPTLETLSKKTPNVPWQLSEIIVRKQGGKMNIIKLFKEGGQIRKMLTAAGGPLINESTRVEKPIIVIPKKIIKSQLSDDNLWEKTDNSNNKVHVYPNLKNDKYVQEFFLYDYAPRFKRLNNFASQDYVNAALNIYKNTPINIYNEDGNTGGYQTGGKRRNFNNFFTKLINSSYIPSSIYLNENYKMNRPTLVHELTHAFRLGYLGTTGDSKFSSAKYPIYNMINKELGNEYYGSGYSNSEKNILNNTYNMEGYKINYNPLYEKGTTNTEVRFRLWKELYDKLGRRPSLEETDEYIKTYDGEKLLKMIKKANAYGETMYNNGMLIDLIKNALINVAQNNNAYLLNDQTYYAKQGGKMIKKHLYGGGLNINSLRRLFSTTTPRQTMRERQQLQANRLNRTNNAGRMAGLTSLSFFGRRLPEDKINNITITESSNAARRDLLNYYRSQQYLDRLRRAGVNQSNSGILSNRLNNVRVTPIDENTATSLRGGNSNGRFRALTRYRDSIVNGRRYGAGIYYNRGTLRGGQGENVYGTMNHEFSHWADQGLTQDARRYNHSLIQGRLNPNAGSYYGSDTEIRARGMDILMNYNNNSNRYRDLDDFLDREGDMQAILDLRRTFRDEDSFRNYMHHFVSNDNPEPNPNMVYYAKSGIHIKKKNKGKFTDYCGGKVTDKCILKGKNSSNPAIRKRATFAANARKWKHEKGGIFKAQNGTNTGQWALLISNVIAQGYNIYKLNLYFNLLAESIKSKNEADKAKYRALMYLNFLKAFNMSPEIDNDGNIINKSDLVAKNEAYKYASSAPYDDSLMLQQLANIELQRTEALNNSASELGNSIVSMMASNALNKNGVPSSIMKAKEASSIMKAKGNLIKNGFSSSTISDNDTLSSIGFKSNVFDSNNMTIGDMKKIIMGN